MVFIANTMRFLVALAVILVSAHAQYIVNSPCQMTAIEQAVDTPGFMGTWYEQERYNVVFETDDTCIKMTYTDNGDGSISLVGEALESDGTPSTTTGTATFIDPTANEGLLNLEIPQYGLNVPLTIVDTDYTGFSLSFSCVDLPGGTSSQMAWIHTRERMPSQATMDAARAVAAANMMDQLWIDVMQEGCTN
ncbi:hypothetical protein B566_EDAN008534 [Ephemera danica]|nr:hypothetical protein B566_EDAN008534 [Ephemera danica]